MKTRKIPATMVTQHPDHAAKPYWHYKAYVSTQYESEEAYRSFAELGATEYKWDWEGKLVDESVIERLYNDYFSYFSHHPLGEEKFLTFRLPNPRIETEFRLSRAFITMASAASIAKHFKFRVPPLFEVILPMTESAEEMLSLQEAYEQIHELKHPLFKLNGFLTNVRVIPLFEQVPTIINSDTILKKYLTLYKKHFKKQPPYMRPYVARSDPALNSGLVPTVLAIKIALSRYKRLSKKLGIPLFPIIGAGSLPFRGGLNPSHIIDFVEEYQGVRTTTIQSAFRYDYPKRDVVKAIALLEKELPKKQAKDIPLKEEKILIEVIEYGESVYKNFMKGIAPLINTISPFIPKRRERFLHIGLFGYSRGEEEIRLPRAITFTAALYSVGIPPELIATGSTIGYAKKIGALSLLEKYYFNLKKDISCATRFLSKKNLELLSKTSGGWKEIQKEVAVLEEYVGESLGPKSLEEKQHVQITEKILDGLSKKKDITPLVKKAAILRKSLG